MRATRRQFLMSAAAAAAAAGAAGCAAPATGGPGPTPACPAPSIGGPTPLPLPGTAGLIDEALFQGRVDEYLTLATQGLEPTNTANVIAHLTRAGREPGFVWDPSLVGPALAGLDPFEDTSDFDLMNLQWVLRLGHGRAASRHHRRGGGRHRRLPLPLRRPAPCRASWTTSGSGARTTGSSSPSTSTWAGWPCRTGCSTSPA